MGRRKIREKIDSPMNNKLGQWVEIVTKIICKWVNKDTIFQTSNKYKIKKQLKRVGNLI